MVNIIGLECLGSIGLAFLGAYVYCVITGRIICPLLEPFVEQNDEVVQQ